MKIAISILLMGAGTLAACASPQPPSRAILAAEVAVSNAEKMPVSSHGNPELLVARQRLEAARTAARQDEMMLAELLAIESLLSSDLAVAKTSLGKATDVSQDMQNQSKAMQQEMLRNKKVTP